MKKAELLKMKQFTVSKKIIRMVQEDAGEEVIRGICSYWKKKEAVTVYKYYRYYMAEVENEILKVAVFTRKHVAAGQKEPDFTVYIDKKDSDWITYNHSTKKWLTGMLINLPYEYEKGEVYGSYGYCSSRETKIVNEYLENEGEVKKSVRWYQADIKKKASEKRHRSELEQIDEVMEAVPELPKDFEDWVVKSAYKNNAYMIYNISKKREGYCTHCKNIVKLKDKPKHNEKAKCSRCRAEVTYKSKKKQQILKEHKKVGIIQRLKDRTGYILRVFSSKMIYRQKTEYKTEFALEEISRFRLNKNFYIQEIFEYREYKYTGVVRWCHEREATYYVASPTSHCTLYEKNIDKLLRNTEGRYVPLKQLLQKNKGIGFYAENALIMAVMYPEIEKIIKAGLERLTLDLIKHRRYAETVKYREKKLEDILGLDKYYTRIAIQMNANEEELRVIQSAYLAGTVTTKELLERAMPFLILRDREDNQIFWNRGKCEKTIHYFEKIQQETEVIARNITRDYEDYLEQLERLQMSFTRNNRFPQHFYEAHEELSQIIREKEDAVKKMEIKEKNKLLKKQVKALQELYYISSKEYVIVWPRSKKDFEEEGRRQHNCVSDYFETMVEEKTTVFFLRKKEEPKKPFCTVEFTNGKLRQCRTACNREAPQEVMKVMKQIECNYQKAMNEKMLQMAAG